MKKIFSISDLKILIEKCKSLAIYVKVVNNDESLKNEVIYHTKFLNEDSSLSKRLYHIKNNIIDYPRCQICDKNLKWNNKYNKYNNCSSKICSHKLNPEKEVERRNKIIESHKNRSPEEKNDTL